MNGAYLVDMGNKILKMLAKILETLMLYFKYIFEVNKYIHGLRHQSNFWVYILNSLSVAYSELFTQKYGSQKFPFK